MASNDDDFTKIEDIPEDILIEEEETDFTSLEDMAKNMGLDLGASSQQEDEPEEFDYKTSMQNIEETSSLEAGNPEENSEDFSFNEDNETNNFSDSDLSDDFESDSLESTGSFDSQDFSLEDDQNNSSEFNNDFDSTQNFQDQDNEFDSDNFTDIADDDSYDSESNFETQNFDQVIDDDQNEFSENSEDDEKFNSEQDSFSDFSSDDFGNEPNDIEESVDDFQNEFSSDFDDQENNSEPSGDEDIPEIPSQALESHNSNTKTTQLQSIDELNEIESSADSPTQKTPIQKIEEQNYTSPERLDDIQDFAQNINFSASATEANPPFSIIIQDLKYIEDVQLILDDLIDIGVIKEDQIENTKTSLEIGRLLIPRLSEYFAIHLCHRLRKYDIEILMGLTEEISPPKNYDSNDRGQVSKNSVYKNKRYDFNLKETDDNIIVSTMDSLEHYLIRDYLGVISKTQIIDMSDFQNAQNIEDEILTTAHSDLIKDRIEQENIFASKSKYYSDNKYLSSNPVKETQNKSLSHIYDKLSQELKNEAISKKANAVLGIKFSISPIIAQFSNERMKYQISAIGNLVWIVKK